MREDVEREKTIRLYSDVLQLWMHKHKDLREATKNKRYDHPLKKRMEGMLDEINTLRTARRKPVMASFRDMERSTINHALTELMGIGPRSRNGFRPVIGGVPYGQRVRKEGRSIYTVTVGHMWRRKVFMKLYSGVETNYEPWVILAADRVKVTHPHIEVYEVSAFNTTTGDTSNGYVAISAINKRHGYFGITASKAINNADRAVQHDIDNAMRGIEA